MIMELWVRRWVVVTLGLEEEEEEDSFADFGDTPGTWSD